MKNNYNKRFTEALGYFACFLVLIFVAYSYFKFGEPQLDEDSGEMMTFLSQRGVKEYLILLGIMFGSLVISTATDRLPFIGVVASGVPIWYILKIIKKKMLVFCPKIIIILTVLYCAGEIVALVQWIRRLVHRSAEGK